MGNSTLENYPVAQDVLKGVGLSQRLSGQPEVFGLRNCDSPVLKEQMTMLRKTYDDGSSVSYAVSYALHLLA